MSKHLELRKLKRKKLYKGKFKYIINLIHITRKHEYEDSLKEIKTVLSESFTGKYSIDSTTRCYPITIYLENITDVILFKLCLSKYMYRAYEIIKEA